MEDEEEFVESLIESVKKQSCLYDKRNGFYYNRSVKESAWDEISEKCMKSVADCKHRWKLLRERFVKEMKKMEVPSGSGKSYLDEWKFLQPMMFLKEFLATRRTRDDNFQDLDVKSALDNPVLSEDSSQDPLTPTIPPTKKIKTSLDSIYQKFEQTIENVEKSISSTPNDHSLDDAFLNIVRCLMKELPELLKEEFQACMLQQLYQLRRENKIK